MIKHLREKAQFFTWQLICSCFSTLNTPAEWKIAHLYPIPKPTDWECNIEKTRPITLLETMRKAFIKILNSHLSHILEKHSVLKGNNFVRLLRGSTEDPIKIINLLLEDA